MNESNPVENTEFSKARNIDDEPAFVWWVPYTLWKRDVIIYKIKYRIWKTNRNYGVQIPSSIEQGKELDSKNGNIIWMDALTKMMGNVGVAFEVLPDGRSAPPTWRKVTGTLIRDVKMDFTRKSLWFLYGRKTTTPIHSTYVGVVFQESGRIAFIHAALNHVDMCAADI